jgi:hypothetical protein
MNLRNFFAEVSGGKVYKIAVIYAGTSWLFYYSFGSSWFKIMKAERSNQHSAEFCVTRLHKNGQTPDDVR